MSGDQVMGYTISTTVPASYDDTVAAVRAALTEQGFGVLTEIDLRAKLKAKNKLRGPAIVMEMDSTTVILPKHTGTVDKYGNILIYPDNFKPVKKPAAKKPAAKKRGTTSGKKSAKKSAKNRK